MSKAGPRAGLLAVLCAGVLAAQDPEARTPVAGTGPMRDLLARGVAVAPVSSGLAFALTITRNGTLIAGPWSLRVRGVSRPLTLSLDEVSWDSGSLEAVARIRNDTGAFAGGLRLEFQEISEARSQPKSRAIALASPLYFGDLPPGGEASLAFSLGPLDLATDPVNTTIRGIVTGVVGAGTIEVADSKDPVAVDSDAQGTTFVGDGAGQAIFRIWPDRKGVRKFETGCPVTGIAVRRKAGETYASCRDVPALVRLSPAGKAGRTDPIGRAPGPIRFGGKGYLYGAPGSIIRLDGLAIAEEVKTSPEGPLQVSGFDVAPDGTIWAVARGKLLRIRSAADITALSGTGEGFGSLASPITCRVGPEGAIYALEGPLEARPPRVTVFDRSGNLLRTWELPAGRPADLAFGTDGRLEIVWKRENDGAAVSAFRIF